MNALLKQGCWVAILGLLFISLSAFNTGGEPLKFEKSTHNFGKVKQNQPVTVEFSFVNESGKTVIIEDATAECGCTKPEFPPRPIAPGKGGTIKVTYDSKTLGAFTKKITVKLVNDNSPIVLSVSGEVVS
jgi:hypothetical protein